MRFRHKPSLDRDKSAQSNAITRQDLSKATLLTIWLIELVRLSNALNKIHWRSRPDFENSVTRLTAKPEVPEE